MPPTPHSTAGIGHVAVEGADDAVSSKIGRALMVMPAATSLSRTPAARPPSAGWSLAMSITRRASPKVPSSSRVAPPAAGWRPVPYCRRWCGPPPPPPRRRRAPRAALAQQVPALRTSANSCSAGEFPHRRPRPCRRLPRMAATTSGSAEGRPVASRPSPYAVLVAVHAVGDVVQQHQRQLHLLADGALGDGRGGYGHCSSHERGAYEEGLRVHR